MDAYVLKGIFNSIVWGGMPIVIVWLVIRCRMNETNKRTQIALAAIEKNSDMDVEKLLGQLSPKKQSLKEKLLKKLLYGSVCFLLGLGVFIYVMVCCYVGGFNPNSMSIFSLWGMVALVAGIAFLINYLVGKKTLAKEIEAEEKERTEKA